MSFYFPLFHQGQPENKRSKFIQIKAHFGYQEGYCNSSKQCTLTVVVCSRTRFYRRTGYLRSINWIERCSIDQSIESVSTCLSVVFSLQISIKRPHLFRVQQNKTKSSICKECYCHMINSPPNEEYQRDIICQDDSELLLRLYYRCIRQQNQLIDLGCRYRRHAWICPRLAICSFTCRAMCFRKIWSLTGTGTWLNNNRLLRYLVRLNSELFFARR